MRRGTQGPQGWQHKEWGHLFNEEISIDVTERCVWTIETNKTKIHTSTSNTLNGRIEVVECLALNYLGADFTANTECWKTTLNDEKSVNRTTKRVE